MFNVSVDIDNKFYSRPQNGLHMRGEQQKSIVDHSVQRLLSVHNSLNHKQKQVNTEKTSPKTLSRSPSAVAASRMRSRNPLWRNATRPHTPTHISQYNIPNSTVRKTVRDYIDERMHVEASPSPYRASIALSYSSRTPSHASSHISRPFAVPRPISPPTSPLQFESVDHFASPITSVRSTLKSRRNKNNQNENSTSLTVFDDHNETKKVHLERFVDSSARPSFFVPVDSNSPKMIEYITTQSPLVQTDFAPLDSPAEIPASITESFVVSSVPANNISTTTPINLQKKQFQNVVSPRKSGNNNYQIQFSEINNENNRQYPSTETAHFESGSFSLHNNNNTLHQTHMFPKHSPTPSHRNHSSPSSHVIPSLSPQTENTKLASSSYLDGQVGRFSVAYRQPSNYSNQPLRAHHAEQQQVLLPVSPSLAYRNSLRKTSPKLDSSGEIPTSMTSIRSNILHNGTAKPRIAPFSYFSSPYRNHIHSSPSGFPLESRPHPSSSSPVKNSPRVPRLTKMQSSPIRPISSSRPFISTSPLHPDKTSTTTSIFDAFTYNLPPRLAELVNQPDFQPPVRTQHNPSYLVKETGNNSILSAHAVPTSNSVLFNRLQRNFNPVSRGLLIPPSPRLVPSPPSPDDARTLLHDSQLPSQGIHRASSTAQVHSLVGVDRSGALVAVDVQPADSAAKSPPLHTVIARSLRNHLPHDHAESGVIYIENGETAPMLRRSLLATQQTSKTRLRRKKKRKSLTTSEKNKKKSLTQSSKSNRPSSTNSRKKIYKRPVTFQGAFSPSASSQNNFPHASFSTKENTFASPRTATSNSLNIKNLLSSDNFHHRQSTFLLSTLLKSPSPSPSKAAHHNKTPKKSNSPTRSPSISPKKKKKEKVTTRRTKSPENMSLPDPDASLDSAELSSRRFFIPEDENFLVGESTIPQEYNRMNSIINISAVHDEVNSGETLVDSSYLSAISVLKSVVDDEGHDDHHYHGKEDLKVLINKGMKIAEALDILADLLIEPNRA